MTEPLEPRRLFAIITVTGIGDTIAADGVVTLREAITAANTNAPSGDAPAGEPAATAVDRIEFNISGGGVHTIAPATQTPFVTEAVVIDGYTQPGAKPNSLAVGDNAIILVELDGSGSGPGFGGDGLVLTGTNIEVRGLAIGGFNEASSPGYGTGISVGGTNNIVAGNFLGLRADGITVNGNVSSGVDAGGTDNRIGGTSPADRNIVSGNDRGITAGTGSGIVSILGNYIGTDASGTQARPNDEGVLLGRAVVFGGSAPSAGNLVSGNTREGLLLSNNVAATDAVVQGNTIGLAADGITPLPNASGIYVFDLTKNWTIGGTLPGQGNVISGNAGPGIRVTRNSTTVAIRGNSIFANGGLGIDQYAAGASGPDGVSPNDANDADDIPNFPVLSSAVASNAGLTVSGVINTRADTALIIDVYASDAPDPSGYGEGQRFLGSIPIALDSFGNNAAFSATLPVTVEAGKYITATATRVVNDPNDDTSEFSRAIVAQAAIVSPPPPNPDPTALAVNDVSASEGNSGTKTFTFTVTRSGPTTGASTVHYATSNGSAGSGDYDAKSGTVSFAAGETTRTINVTVKGDTKVESDETFFVNLSSATGATISDSKGIGTIKNDDGAAPPPPAAQRMLYIDLTKDTNEGNSGTKTISFLVRLDQAASSTVKVNYATSNGSAGSGDYNAASGTLTFVAGQTQKTITITVKGDTKKESDENFFVKLSSPVNAKIADGTAVGIIRNDD